MITNSVQAEAIPMNAKRTCTFDCNDCYRDCDGDEKCQRRCYKAQWACCKGVGGSPNENSCACF